jgi:hypothetical protein
MASRFTAQVPKVGTSWTLILEKKKKKIKIFKNVKIVVAWD